MPTHAEKASAALDAAAQYQKPEGIPTSDWPKVAVLLAIADTQAQVSMALSLERLADKLAPATKKEREVGSGQYL